MRAWLQVRTSEHERAQDKCVKVIRSLGGQPDDATRFTQAADIQLERASQHLRAEIPTWLEQQLGPRPVTPQGATTWDAAVGDIARHRLTHNVPATVAGIGPRPTHVDDAREWDRVNQRIGNTRTWLLQHPDHAEPLWKIVPSRIELIRRGREVEQILDTAPRDQRSTIYRLLSGQLSLTDTQELLNDAVAAQSARSSWIVENWPRVVEAAEIGRALKAGVFGPDTRSLGDAIRRLTNSLALHDDATLQAPWLAAALNAVTSPFDNTIAPRTMNWLEQVADFRDRHGIIDRDPLSQASVDPLQARERTQLIEALDRLFDPLLPVVEPVEETQALDTPEVLPVEPGLESLESLLYKSLGMQPPAERVHPARDWSEHLGRELD